MRRLLAAAGLLTGVALLGALLVVRAREGLSAPPVAVCESGDSHLRTKGT